MTTDPFAATQSAWRSFLETYEPLRADLYRYCRYLTRSPWDAEDLSQDVLARAFTTLAMMSGSPENPKAWLFRVASNLWVDAQRRLRDLPEIEQVTPASDAQGTREAAGTLLAQLGPQERAAVILKDVFEVAIEDIAGMLETTVGAVKAALHRGRGKLADPDLADSARLPKPHALDIFCERFNAGDIDGLAALLLDSASVDVVHATKQFGREAAKRTVLWGMLFGTKLMASDKNPLDARLTEGVLPVVPRAEARLHRGRWIVLLWYKHADGVEAVRGFATLTLDGDRVAHLTNYFYTPEFIIEIGSELNIPVRINGYRWWLS